MAANEPVHILTFGGTDPGASPGTPLRTAEIIAPAATAQAMLAFVHAQRPPYLPAQAELSRGPGGQTVLTVGFSAPILLGLLQP
jgi:hypothetical protein